MKRKNFLVELMSFLWQRKAYWLFPVIFFLIILIFILAIGSSPVSMFIYPMF